MKISDVLWKAANEVLSPTKGGMFGGCCHAIIDGAIDESGDYQPAAFKGAEVFLHELGMRCTTSEFSRFECGAEQQQARHTWLMFAYEIALEEGL